MSIIRYGIIGLGMGYTHMQGIKGLNNATTVAVCDLDENCIKRAQELEPNAVGFKDYKELIALENVDAVVVATPDQLHAEMVEETLKAGKHVLCEKPLALTFDDCKRIVKAADNSDKKFMVGQICRFTPSFKKAKEMIDAGEIGELFFVESEYAHDYEKISGRPYNWRKDPLRHGFLGGGCHAVDLLRWIAGNPQEVSAFSNHKMLKDWPTEDCTVAIMKFPNDVIGKVFVSTGCKRNYTMRSAFYGSKGTIIVDNTSHYMQVFKTEAHCGFHTPMLYPVEINNHNAGAEISAFNDVILGKAPLETDARAGAFTVIASLAAIESARTGKYVKPNYDL